MATAGGSATINGILYQLLGTLARATRLQLDAIQNDETADRVLLRIEPSGGGGDLQIDYPRRRIIEQWKARSGGGTWSLREIINDVLVDLYRAVDDTSLCPDDEYLFITEGRRGSWTEAAAFFAELRAEALASDTAAEIDDPEKIKFFPGQTTTRRELFLYIAGAVSRPARFAGEPPTLTHRKLRHLLGRFRIVEQARPAELINGIDDLLRDIVDINDNVAATRERLCGWLLDLAGQREVTLTPADLLRRVGLNARSFRGHGLLQTTLRERLTRRVAADVNYDRELDVRPTPDFPAESNVLVLSGESGQGKSWLLAGLAHQEFARGRLAVWVRSVGDVERDLAAAAMEVWQQGLDHDSVLSLDRVAARRHTVVPRTDQPWLTVCIDDVQHAEQARELIRQTWAAWNIRLALTLPRHIGLALDASNTERRFEIVHVEDFTVAELQRALQRRGSDWTIVPTDVREVLRRPLLCHLYCQVSGAGDRTWKPASEYELFERCWRRVYHERSQPDYPNDEAAFGKVAADLLFKDDPVYPWPVETLRAAGLDDSAIKRLQAIGWLRVGASGLVEVWHDRLLNHAVAAGLVRARKAGIRATAEIVGAIKLSWTDFHAGLRARLRYVPADVLWLLCGEPADSSLRSDVVHLLEARESGSDGGHEVEVFYQDLLPTLGERVIPFLIDRLRVRRAARWNPYPRYIATALARIGKTAGAAVEASIPPMLHDSSPEMQEAGVLLASVFPLESALDPLWKIHRHNLETRDQQHTLDRTWRGSDYEESFDALRRGVNAHVSWLVSKVRDADTVQEPVSELASLTATLEGENASAIWEQIRDDLFRKVGPPDRHSLANCILHFRDTRTVEQLEEWIVADDDWLAPTAFTALTATAPERALAALNRVNAATMLFYRQWLSELLLQRSSKAQPALLHWIGASDELLEHSLTFFGGHEHQLDTATVDHLLNALERALDEQRASADPHRCSNWFRWGLNSIARINTPHGLSCFSSRAGSSLETKLTDLAVGWVESNAYEFADEIVTVETVLLKIGGGGIQKLINAQLASDEVSWSALRRAPILLDAATIVLVERVAAEEELAETRRGPKPLGQAHALVWLTHAGQNAVVVRAVLRWGSDVIHDDLVDIREAAGPMTDDELKPALEAYHTRDPAAQRRAVCVLGLSGRPDHIPLVRDFLEREAVGSDGAIDAMSALTRLRGDSEASARLLERHLVADKNDYGRHALNALTAIGTSMAQDILERAFTGDIGGIRQYRWKIAARLSRDVQRRARLLPHIWEKMKRTQDYWGSTASECYELLTELPDRNVREYLWRKATPTHSSYDSVSQRANAISALGRIDPEAAYAAAEAELSAEHSLGSFPEIMLRIDPLRAVPRLCDQAARETESAKRWHIARALRLAEKDQETRRVLSDQIESGRERARASACELSGWMGVGFLEVELRRAALKDTNGNVRRAARHSLRRQAREASAQQLAEELPNAASDRQLTVALAIVDLVDPRLLLRLETPVSFHRIMAKLPIAVILRANAKLHDRIRRVDDEAKDRDRKSQRCFSSRIGT